MSTNFQKTIAVADIGTSQIRVTIALKSTKDLTIIGIATSDKTGIKRGNIIAPTETAYGIQECLNKLKNVAPDTQISKLYISYCGFSLMTIDKRAHHSSLANTLIDEKTLDWLHQIDKEMLLEKEQNLDIIESYAKTYYHNGQTIDKPLGETLDSLTVDNRYHVFSPDYEEQINQTFKQVKATPILSGIGPFLSANYFASEYQKRHVVLIDMGAGTTDLVIMQDEEPEYVVSLPFAGNTITSDIAHEFEVKFEHAETLKIKFSDSYNASHLGSDEESINFHYNGQHVEINRKKLQEVIHARVEEIADIIASHAAMINLIDPENTLFILTGKSSRLELCKKLLEEKMATKFEQIDDWSCTLKVKDLTALSLGMLLNANEDCTLLGKKNFLGVNFAKEEKIVKEKKKKEKKNSIMNSIRIETLKFLFPPSEIEDVTQHDDEDSAHSGDENKQFGYEKLD